MDNSEADELVSEEDSDMEVHKLQGCGSRWRLRRFAALAISLESAAAVRPKLSQGLVLPLHAPKPFSGTKARFLCVPFHCCARKERSSVRETLQWTETAIVSDKKPQ